MTIFIIFRLKRRNELSKLAELVAVSGGWTLWHSSYDITCFGWTALQQGTQLCDSHARFANDIFNRILNFIDTMQVTASVPVKMDLMLHIFS
jgi:hypothetical protein